MFIAVFIDMSKAFDTFNHNILLGNLRPIYVTGRVFDWFITYLTERKQHVAVDNMFSISKVVDLAISQ